MTPAAARDPASAPASAVAVEFAAGPYCDEAPFHPAQRWPEYPFGDALSAGANPAYAAVRGALLRLGLDADNAGSAAWNPLGRLVRPGDTVVLKPNFVTHYHAAGGDLYSIVTHPSVLRAVADYVVIAMDGRGRLIIADAPQMDCDFDALVGHMRLHEVCRFLTTDRLSVELMDLRTFRLRDPCQPAFAANRQSLPGDPLGSIEIDLGSDSHFAAVEGTDRFYGADFDRAATIRRHSDGRHSYSVSRTVLSADAVISVPKLKVHKKVGVTLNAKGIVGIVTDKNCLVHYRVGPPAAGGDQLPDAEMQGSGAVVRARNVLFDRLMARQDVLGDTAFRLLHRLYRTLLRPLLPARARARRQLLDAGNWHGNDTAWRMAADLFTLFSTRDEAGRRHAVAPRQMFTVIDGIVGGERDGPLKPDARPAGCILASADLRAADHAAARLMGFDPRRLPLLRAVVPAAPVEVLAESAAVRGMFQHGEPLLDFVPHPGWVGRVEIDSAADGADAAVV